MTQIKEQMIVLLLGCALSALYAAPLSARYSGGEDSSFLELNGNHGKMYGYFGGQDISAEGKVVLTLEGRIPFLTIGDNGSKYLFLQSPDFVFLQDTLNNGCMFLTAKMGKSIESILMPTVVSASSFLVEGGDQYSPQNIVKATFSGLPFVPDRKEGWRNCSLHLEWEEGYPINRNMLIVSNGFVDIDRPQLYSRNSRAREIQVRTDGGENKYTYKLADTPDPQVLFLPKPFKKVDITFFSVYNGSSWDDLCINFIWAGSATSDQIVGGINPK